MLTAEEVVFGKGAVIVGSMIGESVPLEVTIRNES